MRLRAGALEWALGLAAAGVLAFYGVALAQNVPAQFVVTGKAAEQIQDFSTINLATAQGIANACEKAATDQGVQVSITVLDKEGNQVYADRMDGQGYLNVITSDLKARTALLGREPSKNRMNRVIQNPGQEFSDIQRGLFPNAGGLPIVVNKQLIGAVGVGGSAPKPPVWSDEICAHKGLEAVIGASVAPLGPDLPPRQNPNPGNAPVAKFATTTVPKTTLPAEWVVGGKGAATIFDANEISLGAAQKIARGCLDWAAAKGGKASIWVIDSAGTFVHMERMDGEAYNNVSTALLKAQTALKTRQPTSIRAAQLKNNPDGLPRSSSFYNFFGVAGGVPIVVDGQLIGAVGVGGGANNDDENCAVEGLKATFGEHVTLPVYPATASAK